MKYLQVVSVGDAASARLLERPGTYYGAARAPRAVGPGTLYPNNDLPVIIPEPLPRELIAAEFRPGASGG